MLNTFKTIIGLAVVAFFGFVGFTVSGQSVSQDGAVLVAQSNDQKKECHGDKCEMDKDHDKMMKEHHDDMDDKDKMHDKEKMHEKEKMHDKDKMDDMDEEEDDGEEEPGSSIA